MSDTESKNKRYIKPTDVQCFVLDLFLNRMYVDRHRLDRYGYFIFTMPDDPDHKKFYFEPIWNNDPKAIYQQYCNEFGSKEGYSKGSLDQVRRFMTELLNKGILKKNPNRNRALKEYKYYPNETSEGFISLIDLVTIHYIKGSFPENKFGLNPLYSRYSDKLLNRQFVLDCLKTKIGKIRILYKDRLVDLPLVGRYLKNYEMDERLESVISTLSELEELLKDKRLKTYRKMAKCLIGPDEPLPEGDYHITETIREKNIDMVRKLKEGFEKELDFMKEVKKNNSNPSTSDSENFSDENSMKFYRHQKSITSDSRVFLDSFGILGYSWYRDEALYHELYLSETDMKALESIESGLSEFYQDFMDGIVTLPILCLLQSSPTALVLFRNLSLNMDNPTVSFSNTEMHLHEFEIDTEKIPDDEIRQFMGQKKTFNEKLGMIVENTIRDFMFNNINKTVFEGVHDTVNRIKMISFGQNMIETSDGDFKQFDTIFMFRICFDYLVGIRYNKCPDFKPIDEIMPPHETHAKMMDWSPAMGFTFPHVQFPYLRLYELMSNILSSVEIDNSYLYNLIELSIKGDHI